jgi:predicted RecB family nuclease
VPSSYPIGKLPGITPEIASALKSAGIRTTGRFLEAAKSPKGRRNLSLKTAIGEAELLEMANAADRMRVPGLGEEYAELLRAAGVRTVRELKYRTPASLAERLADANKKRKLVRLLPTERTVGRWIEAAKKLTLKITYR